MSVRTETAAALEDALPDDGWDVVSTWRELNDLHVTTVQVGTTTYTPDPLAPMAGREITQTLWLLSPFTDPDDAEDPLEDSLDVLLAVLDQLPWLVWQTAERSKYPTGYPAYKITATSPSSRPEPS